MIRMGKARPRLAVNRFQPHPPHHQPMGSTTPHDDALPAQVARHLPAAVEGVPQRQGVHPPHQGQILPALPPAACNAPTND